MNIRGIIAGIIAVCFVGGVMPSADVISDNTVIIAGAVDEAEYTEGTYKLVKYKNYGDHIEISGCDRTASEVVIPSEIDGLPVTSIEEYTCCSLPILTSLIIPESVTSIGDVTFTHCPYLRSVVIPDSVTSIGESVFYDTPWLEDKRKENPLVIVNNILIDGKTCSGGAVIPEGVTSICGLAFSGSTLLESIKIPESVTSIGRDAFFGTPWLENKRKKNPLVIENNILIDGETCSGNVVIPEGVTSICPCAFDNNANLKSIKIPDSVKSINKSAFEFCSSLRSIEISEGVTNIGENAFYKCSSLISIE
ncbi:MAG: leucine-rich repeat domain-containing protein, partial [Ruminococcus sp.]|nr:leucine-rich repeat domain-containing protein [Ruminococcus sp.]